MFGNGEGGVQSGDPRACLQKKGGRETRENDDMICFAQENDKIRYVAQKHEIIIFVIQGNDKIIHVAQKNDNACRSRKRQKEFFAQERGKN